jgi:4-carboxymuconolactone decarboxylase
MAISEIAQRNHDQLFPGHVSTLKVTDPELIEIFDNFAFDETLGQSKLNALAAVNEAAPATRKEAT